MLCMVFVFGGVNMEDGMTYLARPTACVAMIAIFLAALCSYANADADWVRYYMDKHGNEYYYDGYTLVAQRKGIFNVWTKRIEFDARGTVITTQPVVLFHINCNHKSSVIMKSYLNDEQIEKSDMVPAIPEVALKALHKAICK